MGRSDRPMADTVKFAHSENLRGTSPIQVELYPICVLKFCLPRQQELVADKLELVIKLGGN